MRTEDLVAALAADARPVDAARAGRRFAVRLAVSPLLALGLMLVLFGVRADLAASAGDPMFWLKVAVPAALFAAAWTMLYRLGHPGMRLGHSTSAAIAPVALLWAVGLLVLWQASPGERLPLVLGQTWRECPFAIALLSLPVFVAALRALRGLAPTRLRRAGAAAGLLAGAAGGFAYAFHCPESAPPFQAVWYVAGMLVPTLAGAALGPRLLRW